MENENITKLPDNAPLPPLADPVIGAIFCDVEHAGLAAASLSGAVVGKDGITIGEVISVTPQGYHKSPGERGVCIDVEAITGTREHIVIEVETCHNRSMFQRNLLSASRIFTQTTSEGTRPRDLIQSMPNVIAINLLDFIIREGATGTPASEYLQPVKPLYTKPPHEAAFSNLMIYNIQLPRFREAERDFNDPLYSWIYTIETAQCEKKNY